MKTAEECLAMLSAVYSCPDVALTETIALIQLDAMKEGMRRAAGVKPILQPAEGYTYIKHQNKVILAAAEQLTEKDL